VILNLSVGVETSDPFLIRYKLGGNSHYLP